VELVRRGGRLALGCDAHNAGDVPDVLHAAYLLAALERDHAIPGEGLRADQVFALATIDGARAIGMGDVIGSIEVGKVADLVVLDARGPTWTPRGDLALHLVWGAASANVRDVVVNGRVVLRDRQVVGVDVPLLLREANDRAAALLRRAGIEVPHRWPTVGAADYEPAAIR
jgi:5-methylthioadenosine/S-adenosylhomocysteine deaminase